MPSTNAGKLSRMSEAARPHLNRQALPSTMRLQESHATSLGLGSVWSSADGELGV